MIHPTKSSWPPRSPYLTSCAYFLWGCVKATLYIPPLPSILDNLKNQTTTAIEYITKYILLEVWNESTD